MRAQMNPRYLVSESFDQIVQMVMQHPFLGSLFLLVLFAVVLGILKKIFERIAYDTVIFALIVWALVLIFGSAGYTLLKVKGFYFGG
jgi:hypothetical protein